MPKKRYTRQELFILRNDIPVNSLIQELKIPFKISEGYFRFCCPKCREFNTSVDPRTNLARCFYCKDNYNTIDLVEIVRGWDFINSVEFLKKFHDNKERSTPPQQAHRNPQTTDSGPVSVGTILESMAPVWKVNESCTSKNQKDNKDNEKPMIEQLNMRILSLEKQVKYLLQKIKAVDLKN